MSIETKIGIEPIIRGEEWRFNQDGIHVLSKLFQQLSPYRRPLSMEDFLKMVDEGECLLAVDLCQNGHIVGIARLVPQGQVPSRFGIVHDVVVDTAYRGQHIGKRLMERAIEIARRQRLTHLELTSKPARVAANRRYQSLGFELTIPADPKDPASTNHYRLMLG